MKNNQDVCTILFMCCRKCDGREMWELIGIEAVHFVQVNNRQQCYRATALSNRQIGSKSQHNLLMNAISTLFQKRIFVNKCLCLI